MEKPYHEMTADERLRHRIATNRGLEKSTPIGKLEASINGVTARLAALKRRATYGAVAAVVGGTARGLMTGSPKTLKNSWIVAATTSGEAVRGWPTGYTKEQIDPACYEQILANDDNIIDNGPELRALITTKAF